jgi:hypothetical protein
MKHDDKTSPTELTAIGHEYDKRTTQQTPPLVKRRGIAGLDVVRSVSNIATFQSNDRNHSKEKGRPIDSF